MSHNLKETTLRPLFPLLTVLILLNSACTIGNCSPTELSKKSLVESYDQKDQREFLSFSYMLCPTCGQVARSVGCRKPTEFVQGSSPHKTVERFSPESPANVSGCLLRSGNSKQINSLQKGQFTFFKNCPEIKWWQYIRVRRLFFGELAQSLPPPASLIRAPAKLIFRRSTCHTTRATRDLTRITELVARGSCWVLWALRGLTANFWFFLY